MSGDSKLAPEALSREAAAWVDRLKSGAMTHAEAEGLRRWRGKSPDHARAFAEASVLAKVVGEAALGLRRAPVLVRRPATRLDRRAFLGGALAASAATAAYVAIKPPLGLWPSVEDVAQAMGADWRTARGQRRDVAVASSTVALNTQSAMARLDEPGQAGVRLIAGEAAVEAHGAFLIKAADGAIATVGGALNVRVDPAQVCVTCLSGAALIRHPKGHSSLRAGEQLTYASGALGRPAPVDTEVVAAWRRGALIFHDQPLSSVIAEVNRYRNGRILIVNPALGRRRVYASFHLNRIGSVVEQVRQLSGAHVAELGALVILS